ncbi:hypothetical protein HYH03_017816 [Edaphochlamys debaryana]|uniref:Uncharacterized protein n=1 Tax=Edaphochlamys debaryana TaxID=47281 RepID=A0A835XH63_9CHLO|nr:hypothetical protein HYH03_017814 [Edaphochlamys debaryana]KAG2483314.1 hypothetical protein HYH03_017816 [Edaphochlamys debaryana]|eukprot:KAG2483311.1 hypothetical protein HYH03_017814 [Edaphochlamys debaryana]
MAPEFATVFSAIIAVTSVSINLYGGLITEKRRAELAREVERERQLMASAEEERSVVARYRGPLLEATADLEQRLYHIATLSGEWRSGEVVCEEEVVYTLFTLAQWLGFLEVIRREGPRERSFLIRKPGNGTGTGYSAGASGPRPGFGSRSGLFGSGFTGFGPAASGAAAAAAAAAPEGGFDGSGGADTLTTLVEGFRFVLSAHPATLQKWYEQGPERDHPGRRSRVSMLRGTAALRNVEQREAHADTYGTAYEAAGGGGGGSGSWPPPPSQVAVRSSWAPVSAASTERPAVASMADVGGGGDGTWYGSDVGTTLPYGMPPPPTMPVVLGGAGGTAGSAVGPSAAGSARSGRSELVIGSLDECDLAAAGLGMSDPAAELAAGLAAAQSVVAASAASAPASTSGQLLTTPLTSAQAAAIIAGSGSSLSSFSSLSSVGSLSSYDEASWNAAGAGGGGDGVGSNGGGGARRRARAPRDVFHVSRGSQRSIGSLMVITPMGASRHYTLSYGDFYNRYYLDEFFAGWLRPVHTDILALVGGRKWSGQGPFPINRWTRLLLLQQLLVEAIDVLDPAHVRVPADRRVVLAPVECQRAPELEAYKARMRELSTLDSPLALQQQLLAGQGGPLGPVRAWWAARVAETAANAAAAATGGTSQGQGGAGLASGQGGAGADEGTSQQRGHEQLSVQPPAVVPGRGRPAP